MSVPGSRTRLLKSNYSRRTKSRSQRDYFSLENLSLCVLTLLPWITHCRSADSQRSRETRLSRANRVYSPSRVNFPWLREEGEKGRRWRIRKRRGGKKATPREENVAGDIRRRAALPRVNCNRAAFFRVHMHDCNRIVHFVTKCPTDTCVCTRASRKECALADNFIRREKRL